MEEYVEETFSLIDESIWAFLWASLEYRIGGHGWAQWALSHFLSIAPQFFFSYSLQTRVESLNVLCICVILAVNNALTALNKWWNFDRPYFAYGWIMGPIIPIQKVWHELNNVVNDELQVQGQKCHLIPSMVA